MGSLANTLGRLAQTAAKTIDKLGTDSFFVLRETATPNNRGATVKSFAATTTNPIPCFYAVVSRNPESLEEEFGQQRKPVVFRRFVCAATVDVKTKDRLRLVARDTVPQIDMEILRVEPLSGVLIAIITAEASAS